jgi:7,8-dihydropterin-6-yl-methyl-4-(beta-D-ribofuranosyl)aminobenzene 5'-phosphate synthase
MSIRITILCDNSVGPISGTLGEHGFAVLIEPSGGAPLLFDTGQGATLLHNARRMNKDLGRVRQVVISHGHYDHAGGLLPLLQEFGPREVYCHPSIFVPRYRLMDGEASRPIGMIHDRWQLEAAGATFNLSANFRALAPGIFLTGEVPRLTPFETGDRGIYRDLAGREPDSTPDDQSLVLETVKGLVIILGCCHAGLINTLDHVANSIGRRDLYALIGGTHLGFCGRDQLEKTIAALRKAGISKLAASHCTGFSVSARLLRELPKAFQVAQVGYSVEFS